MTSRQGLHILLVTGTFAPDIGGPASNVAQEEHSDAQQTPTVAQRHRGAIEGTA